MITKPLITLTMLLCCYGSFAQNNKADSLKRLLATEKKDTSRVLLLFTIARAFEDSKPDTAMSLAMEGLNLARKIGFGKGEKNCLRETGNILLTKGSYPAALTAYLQDLKLAEQSQDDEELEKIFANISSVYYLETDMRRSIDYAHKAIDIARKRQDTARMIGMINNLANTFAMMKQFDSGLSYSRLANTMTGIEKDAYTQGALFRNMGNMFNYLGRFDSSMFYYKSSIEYEKESSFMTGLYSTYYGMAEVFLKQKKTDSSLYYAKLSYTMAKDGESTSDVLNASRFLATYYKSAGNIDSAFMYQSAAMEANDSLFSQQKTNQLQNMTYDETVRQLQIEDVKKEEEIKARQNALIGGLATLLLVAFLLVRNNRQKQKANRLLTRQKHDIEDQRDKTNKALSDLQQTQAQLVQSEKMASLGELTAGIAHEIQNPLNFVNNFSEVNKEMIEEATEEMEKGNYDDVKNILTDIKGNEEKINHHGRRADAIVKGMLQHSRKNNGVKEPTDINALCDEYLRLSYHGLRAKDKVFNADFKTDFDESIGKINIVPQDMGRVFLNLINNAFYAVNERKKLSAASYQPFVSIQTKRINNEIEIVVKDNGSGISKTVIDKIFQPFFTSKPTGEGTGLGLSLSYDIITKEHNGTIRAESEENSFTKFIITIPS